MSKRVPPDALNVIEMHHDQFMEATVHARRTLHPVPCDSRAWSQILVSTLTGINGVARKKGADFADKSDAKACCMWEAIDVPRFNGVLSAGRKDTNTIALANGKLDATPMLFFVLWDHTGQDEAQRRCRVWIIRPPTDTAFRSVCTKWFSEHASTGGTLKSANLQFHAPKDDAHNINIFTNNCGNLEMPLLFHAVRAGQAHYAVMNWNPSVLGTGVAKLV